MSVRVRYGPSPTGEPHVGNIRTALFDWLLARRFGGQFIVRIEDTDQSRAVEGTEQLILDALTWLGLDWDEGPDVGGPFGPYRQSERLPLYVEAANRLLDEGKAYRCVCTSERLDALRKSQQKAKLPPGYDRRCRELGLPDNQPHVVRLAMPLEGDTVVSDYLRGDVSFQNSLLDDHVLLKRDGFPTYHLASVVDDHHMQITHVIRGDEWLSSAPRHVQTYAALGWDEPVWVHLPIIRGPDKGKLSKRHGATSVREYADKGFLPEALLNFLALLGWSRDETTTIMSRDEIVESFDLDGLGLASAMFDIERLSEMNARYIRDLDPADFLRPRQAAPGASAGPCARRRCAGSPADHRAGHPGAGQADARVRRLHRLLLQRRAARLRQRGADGQGVQEQALGGARVRRSLAPDAARGRRIRLERVGSGSGLARARRRA